MDGMIYVTVGKNVAEGQGSFWHPHFTAFFMSNYHEQPPLLFSIEAVFFKLLGYSLYTERIYSLLLAIITCLLIIKTWQLLHKNTAIEKYNYLPVLLFLSVPVVVWSYVNLVSEITMAVFSLSAFHFMLLSYTSSSAKQYLHLAVAAFFLIAAGLCKGVQGIFPICFPFFYWLFFKKISFAKMAAHGLYMLFIITGFLSLICLNDNVLSSFELYFNNRIVNTFKLDEAATTANRFSLIITLVSELAPVMVIGLALRLIAKEKYQISKTFMLLLTLGLAGSLPLMVTLEQRGFYIFTSIPFFVLAFASVFASSLAVISEKLITKSNFINKANSVLLMLLLGCIGFSAYDLNANPIKRDKDILHDVYITGPIVKDAKVIAITTEMHQTWVLYAYYKRYFNVSLNPYSKNHSYLLIEKTEAPDSLVTAGFSKVNLPTMKYDLYRQNK